jgi:hypothetical protein
LSDAQFVAAGQDALELIEHDWPAIERVAEALLDAGELGFHDVEKLVEPA